jgi:hypothetical protein
MPEFHTPEEERALRRLNTRLLCVGLAFKTHALTFAEAGDVFQKLKDTCDKHEIRRLDDHRPDGPHTYLP